MPTLAQLRDIHLPEPISIWPPAPGWFLLAFLILGILSVILFFFYRHWKKQAPKRAALKQLTELECRYQKNQETNLIFAELSILLRRLALAYYPRMDAAGLQGDSWLTFLNTTGKTTAFTSQLATQLTQCPYQKNPQEELGNMFVICRKWIKLMGKCETSAIHKALSHPRN